MSSSSVGHSTSAMSDIKITKAFTTGIAALAFVALAAAATATSIAAPAKADISCPNGFVPIPLAQAGFFTDLDAAAYCPSNMRKVS